MSTVADLHKSAFWIYGVTAMVMREPLANLLRHAAESGIGSAAVLEEGLRVVVVLALMSRFFLAAGLFFDEVHLRPHSYSVYPKRSYPLDFLCGLMQLLLAVTASAAVQLKPAFAVVVGAFLLFENLWLAVSAAMRLSTVSRVGEAARAGTRAFLVCGTAWAALAAAGLAWAAQVVPLAILLGLTAWESGRLVRAYDDRSAASAPAAQ